jgi:adenylosuccinate lyase
VIARYSLPEMAAVWSEERKLAVWKEVECLALEAWGKLGRVPLEVATAARSAPVPTPAQVMEREQITEHDLAAFVDVLAASIATGGEWVHYGLTSSDVLDSAGGVQLRDAADILLDRIAELFEAVRGRALEHRDTIMVGRTHGIWAEPTSFGLKLATWAFEIARNHRRLATARETVAVGKASGVVGSYSHAPPEVEAYICERLGIGIEPASSQVTMRDRHAEFLQTIALVGASLERFATEVRHLQRSEVGEVREPFAAGGKGSSAMPHKRNPVISERVTGMARLLRGYGQVGLENVALWHERDISHSSAERVVLPDACLALHYMLVKFTSVVKDMVVDVDRMRANLGATRGLVFSQAVLLALVEEQGLERDNAYRIVQRLAMRVWEEGGDLAEMLASDPEVNISKERLAACFDPRRYLVNSRVVFERLEMIALGAISGNQVGSSSHA